MQDMGSHIERALKNRYQLFWNAWINQRLSAFKEFKMDFMAIGKKTFQYEPYLDALSDYSLQKCVSKLRLSNHSLEIEKGRHRKRNKAYVERKNRICKLCKVEVEDEEHFLLRCTRLAHVRNRFLNELNFSTIYDITNCFHFNQDNNTYTEYCTLINKVAQFIKNMFTMRDALLS